MKKKRVVCNFWQNTEQKTPKPLIGCFQFRHGGEYPWMAEPLFCSGCFICWIRCVCRHLFFHTWNSQGLFFYYYYLVRNRDIFFSAARCDRQLYRVRYYAPRTDTRFPLGVLGIPRQIDYPLSVWSVRSVLSVWFVWSSSCFLGCICSIADATQPLATAGEGLYDLYVRGVCLLFS